MRLYAWLDQICGADAWMTTPAGRRSVVNDAVAIYFRDAVLAGGFAARLYRKRLPEIIDGTFFVRDDDPVPPRCAPLHRTP